MAKTVMEVFGANIKNFVEEGRLTEKDADVLVTRISEQLKRKGIYFDEGKFYEVSGLDINKIPEGKELN